jgi:hypothetical protein
VHVQAGAAAGEALEVGLRVEVAVEFVRPSLAGTESDFFAGSVPRASGLARGRAPVERHLGSRANGIFHMHLEQLRGQVLSVKAALCYSLDSHGIRPFFLNDCALPPGEQLGQRQAEFYLSDEGLPVCAFLPITIVAQQKAAFLIGIGFLLKRPRQATQHATVRVICYAKYTL